MAKPDMRDEWEMSSSEEEVRLPPEPTMTYLPGGTVRIEGTKSVDKPYLKPRGGDAGVLLEDRYYTACYLTGNLSCRQYLYNLPTGAYRIQFYDSPYQEFTVQSLFLEGVSEVDVRDVDINLDFMVHLIEDNRFLTSLVSISLRSCNLTGELLEVICPELENAFQLLTLDLTENPIKDEGFKVICLHLYDWTSVRNLILRDVQITSKGLDMLSAIYSERRIFLTKLDLSYNNFSRPTSIRRFLAAISKQSPPLEEIILCHCGFTGSETSAYFPRYLPKIKLLKLLDLSLNLFKEKDDAVNFSAALMETPLSTLNMSFNQLDESTHILLIQTIYNYPNAEVKKTLIIDNYTIPQNFYKANMKIMARNDINIIHSGIRKLEIKEIESRKALFVKKFYTEYKKTKPRKDMIIETIKENIPEKSMEKAKSDDFRNILMSFNIEDNKLIEEVIKEFSVKGSKVNAKNFIEMYETLIPKKAPKDKKITLSDKPKKKKKK